MDKSKANYISVFGQRLVEPIFTLLHRLLAEPYAGVNEVQTGGRENGYSVSVCLLLVVLLESMIVRARSVTPTKRSENDRHPLDFLKSAYPDCPLLTDVEEVFVLRDVIAHNHIWHVQFAQDPDNWMKLIQREIDEASGDKKFAKVVDVTAGITKRLQLKIIPTQIDRFDVAAVFKIVLATIRFIDNRENDQLASWSLNGLFGTDILDMWQVAEQFEASLPRPQR